MIAKDFKIDLKNKRIYHNPTGSKKIYAARELYSFLQDTFDEPDKMRYEVPIIAKSKTEFSLVNGWSIDEKDLKYLKGIINN